MSFNFNICEVFEIAEELERNGDLFYRKISNCFDNEQTQKKLLGLADLDRRHSDKFAEIKKGFSQTECPPTVFDPDNEDALYLRAMADGHVFDIKKDLCVLVSGQSEKKILRLAVKKEKEALAFYLGLKAAVPNQADKDKVETIIKAKMRQLGVLNQELAALG